MTVNLQKNTTSARRRPSIDLSTCPPIVRVILGQGTKFDETLAAMHGPAGTEADWQLVQAHLALIDQAEPFTETEKKKRCRSEVSGRSPRMRAILRRP